MNGDVFWNLFYGGIGHVMGFSDTALNKLSIK